MNSIVVLGALIAVAAGIRGIWSPCGLSMLTSINPLAEKGRGHRYAVTAGWFMVGAIAGGLTLGMGAAVLAEAIHLTGLSLTVRLSLAAVASLLAALGDAGGLGATFPILRRQVNERWLDQFRGWFYGAGFGWQIGVGFATYVMSAAVILTVVLGALSGSPVAALCVGILFGLVRGAGVLVSSRATTQSALRQILRRLDAIEEPIRLMVMSLEAAVACAAGLMVAGWLGVVLGASGLVVVAVSARRKAVIAGGR
jgi:hypothetical protein